MKATIVSIVICSFIAAVLINNHYYIYAYNFIYIAAVIYFLLLPFSIYFYYNDYKKHKGDIFRKNNRDSHSLMENLISAITIPCLVIIIFHDPFVYIYTLPFGDNNTYTAIVIDKYKKHSYRHRSLYYIKIMNDIYGINLLNDKELYNKVTIGNKLKISKTTSKLGEVIPYSEIKIVYE